MLKSTTLSVLIACFNTQILTSMTRTVSKLANKTEILLEKQGKGLQYCVHMRQKPPTVI